MKASAHLQAGDRADVTTIVRGEFASYEGLDTPVASSPCGLCIAAGDAILVSRPVRAFAWLENIRPSIHEELIVPLQDSSGRVEGTLWIAHHEDDRHCSADDARIVEQLANQIVLARSLQEGARDREQALSILQSLQAAQQSLLSHDLSHERSQRQQAEASELEARRELTFKETMIDEVNHRTKNTLHTVAALLSIQARIASSEEVRRALLDSRDRLQLLADVHAMISAGHDKSQTVLMPALLEQLCNALRRSFGNIRPDVSLELSCDPITLPVADAVAIALFSNETVTNAYRHAFSNGSAERGCGTAAVHAGARPGPAGHGLWGWRRPGSPGRRHGPEADAQSRSAAAWHVRGRKACRHLRDAGYLDDGSGRGWQHLAVTLSPAALDVSRSFAKKRAPSILHTAGSTGVKSLVALPIAARIVEV
jgi:two-component sensor histidine kinase